jgi:hypothetical protein
MPKDTGTYRIGETVRVAVRGLPKFAVIESVLLAEAMASDEWERFFGPDIPLSPLGDARLSGG